MKDFTPPDNPADVCWFQTFKLLFRRKNMYWFVNEQKSFTNFGNIRSPGYASVIIVGLGHMEKY